MKGFVVGTVKRICTSSTKVSKEKVYELFIQIINLAPKRAPRTVVTIIKISQVQIKQRGVFF